MPRTFIRQDAQIRNSVNYLDNVAPTVGNYETVAPQTIEDDFTSLRSQVQNMLNRNGAGFPAGKWYDDIVVPSYLEPGLQRGISALDTGLHAIEKKRILRDVFHLDPDIAVPADVKATDALLLNSIPLNNETVTIGVGAGVLVYTFKTVLTPANGEVLIDVSGAACRDNLMWAITNAGGHPGKFQVAGAHTQVTATAGAGAILNVQALLGGTQGNLIAATETLSDVLSVWTTALLTGGTGDIVILAALELPTQTISAQGAVTTLGTVTKYIAGFGKISLATVGGPHLMNPRNLMLIQDNLTGDPILSSGREVYGLLQVENIADGDIMTGVSPHQAQISFVRPNVSFDDLEYCPSADIAGKSIHYATRERVRLENLDEWDFLHGAVIDVGAGAVTPTRQLGYDNQGVTPVVVTTHSYLKLGAAGEKWEIRDLLNAALFDIVEGSGAGTTKIELGTDVDLFKSLAIVNNFNAGLSVATAAAGTTINLGVTANQIDSGGGIAILTGGAGNLEMYSVGGKVEFRDVNRVGSTWVGTTVNLSDATGEWNNYRTEFGEVSLMNAIVQAKNTAKRVKGYAKCVANRAAGLDVDKTTTAILDVDLPSFAGVGTFVDDVDVYLNGDLLRNEASYPGLHDVAPGSTPAQGMLKFEFALHGTGTKPDQLCMIVWGS